MCTSTGFYSSCRSFIYMISRKHLPVRGIARKRMYEDSALQRAMHPLTRVPFHRLRDTHDQNYFSLQWTPRRHGGRVVKEPVWSAGGDGSNQDPLVQRFTMGARVRPCQMSGCVGCAYFTSGFCPMRSIGHQHHSTAAFNSGLTSPAPSWSDRFSAEGSSADLSSMYQAVWSANFCQ